MKVFLIQRSFFIIAILLVLISSNYYVSCGIFLNKHTNSLKLKNSSEDPDPSENDDDPIGWKQLFIDIFNYTLFDKKPTLTDSCKETLNNIIQPENVDFFYAKMFSDSGKTKNDLGSFSDCTTISYLDTNSTDEKTINLYLSKINYVLMDLYQNLTTYTKSDLRSEGGRYLLGFCIFNNCTTEDYANLFISINSQLENPLNLTNLTVTTYIVSSDYLDFTDYKVYLFILLMLLTLVFIIFSCNNSIPKKMLYFCCVKKSKKVESGDDDRINTEDNINNQLNETNNNFIHKSTITSKKSARISGITNTNNTDNQKKSRDSKEIEKEQEHLVKIINKVASCFSIDDNLEYLFIKPTTAGYSFLKGIYVLVMIYLVFGHVYLELYLSPINLFNEKQLLDLISGLSFTWVIFGVKFCPNILFSLNGFTLTYKLISYLDECLLKETDEDEFLNFTMPKLQNNENNAAVEEEEKKKDSDASINKNSIDGGSRISRLSFVSNSPDKIKFKKLWYFIFSQAYKYLIFIGAVLYFKYFFCILIHMISQNGPLFVFLKNNIVDKYKDIEVISSMLLIKPLIQPFIDLGTIYPFWIAFNDIIFFIFTSFLIFICYKKNVRLDNILLCLVFISLTLKIVAFILLYNEYEYYPLFLTSHKPTQYFLYFNQSPFFKYSSYAIGAFFGLVNYVTQKTVDHENYDKRYLTLPIALIKRCYNKMCKSLFFVIGGMIVLFLLTYFFSFSYLIFANKNDYMCSFNKNIVINLIYLITDEIYIFTLFITIFAIFLLGENFIIDFLSHSLWNFFVNIYYMFIVMMNPIIYFSFYHSESKIKLEMFNVVFFTLFICVLLIMFSIFFSLTVMLPLKRMNKLLVHN